MELTRQDKEHIQKEVNRLAMRINIESREYARLYERTYLKALIEQLKERIEIANCVEEKCLQMSNHKQ